MLGTAQMYVPIVRGIFQEVLMIGMCIMNAQEGWELKNI